MNMKRIHELEIIRGIAFLSIVMQHTIGSFFYQPNIQVEDQYALGLLYHFTKFGVPIFVFITGITLFYNHHEKLKFFPWFKKRITNIFIPYVLWSLIYIVYVVKVPNLSTFGLGSFFKELYNPKIGYHLWYIVLIFQFYLLFPLFLKFVKWTIKKEWVKHTLILFFALYGLYTWFSYSYLPVHSAQYPLWLQNILLERNNLFVSYLFYFLMGSYTAIYLSEFRVSVKRSPNWNIFLFIGLFTVVGYELFVGFKTNFTLNWSTTIKPFMFILVVSEIYLVYGLSLSISKSKSHLNGFFSWIGKYSFGGFLIHALILSYSNEWLYKMNVTMLEYHYLETTITMFLIVSFASIMITYLLSLLPYGHFLTGVKKQKQKNDRADKIMNNVKNSA